jgi:para-nitrobenzyl esterase
MDITRREFTSRAVLLLAGGAHMRSAIAMEGSAPIVETRYGKVRGAVQDGICVFKGIPYGASTAGANRFMPPQKPASWSSVRDCLTWAPIAPQGASTANPSGMGKDFQIYFGNDTDAPRAQSEDCLALNVFTPGVGRGHKRPVMVWIHGGGFSIGAGSGARANGIHLARKHNVITVSVGHRLGVLGYCHLGDFDKAFEHSGNVGQLDLIASLQWIRDNIEAFGGDPKQVMIHGESGGGAKITTLLGMPMASGLFQRAILQSGTANRLPSHEQASQLAEKLLNELQVPKDQLKQLQQLPVERLIAAASKLEMALQGARGFSPASGTVDLPTNPIDAVASGSAKIPLIIGCTKHEAALFLAGSGTDPRKIDENMLSTRVHALFGDKANEILAGYRADHPDYSAADLLIRIMTDRIMRSGAIELAQTHVKAGGAPTYAYMFTWESPVLPYMRAGHGIDGTFYFDNTESVDIAKGNPDAKALAAAASTAWATFARTGKPAAPGLPTWPEYTLPKRDTMIFAAKSYIEADPMKADRELFQRLA